MPNEELVGPDHPFCTATKTLLRRFLQLHVSAFGNRLPACTPTVKKQDTSQASERQKWSKIHERSQPGPEKDDSQKNETCRALDGWAFKPAKRLGSHFQHGTQKGNLKPRNSSSIIHSCRSCNCLRKYTETAHRMVLTSYFAILLKDCS